MEEKIKNPFFVKAKGEIIQIFQNEDGNEKQIGEYKRSYHSFKESTFSPFIQNGKWYALYSSNYTCTRLMSLPDCKDIGGEQPAGWGFCPVEYCVPILCVRDYSINQDKAPYNPRHDPDRWAKKVEKEKWIEYVWPEKDPVYIEACEKHDKEFDKWNEEHSFVYKYANFGFVAGCIWGDDSSWKIQYLDLKEAEKGILKRDDRFGYIELPYSIKLKDAIYTDLIDDVLDEENTHVQIAIMKTFKLNGQIIE